MQQSGTIFYDKLSKKWAERHAQTIQAIGEKHAGATQWLKTNIPGKEHVASASLGGLLLLSSHSVSLPPLAQAEPSQNEENIHDIGKEVFVMSDLQSILPQDVRPLTSEEEKKVAEILTRDFKVPVSAELDQKRLNRSYGYIGQEQHLMRYPGDTIATHFSNDAEAVVFAKYGMAPGRGAWGYFAPDKNSFTEKDAEREKWYIATQTFLAPDFYNKTAEYRDFFKYRKMLVVNPDNGKAVIAVIGDAGPASWTGKHLGGSPEVMRYLERVDGRQKGPVLYFFVDDANDTIPLGPVTL